MLTNFYECFFFTYRGYYTLKEFCYLNEYFFVHIFGLEQRHSVDAKAAAERWAVTQENLNYIIEGASRFLKSQASLWDGLYREIISAEGEGARITPYLSL